MIRIGLIGYGQWGPNLARNIAQSRGASLDMVCDREAPRLAEAERTHPGLAVTTSWRELAADPAIDAVAIATPVESHAELALAALRAGKHVLVEKPLARTSTEAIRLIEAAEARGLVLMVDHTFVFSPAVRMIRELVATGVLGEPWYYDSVRVNLGLIRHDVNVLWDLAAHDLAILDELGQVEPCALQATGVAPEPGAPERLGYLTLRYASGFLAHIHASWLAPLKVRRTLLGGSRRIIVYDDLEPVEKVKVFDRGIESVPESSEPRYRIGDVWSPELESLEPLHAVLEHFVGCIAGGQRPRTDGAAGLRVVRLLEAASRSLAAGGAVIELEADRVPA